MAHGELIAGFGAGGFRSLRDHQYIGPLRKVSLIAGQNNTGKSNVLRFASNMLTQRAPELEWPDTPIPPGPPLELSVGYVEPDRSTLDRLQESSPSSIEPLLELFANARPDGSDVGYWVKYSVDGNRWAVDDGYLVALVRASQNARQVFNRACERLMMTHGGTETADARRIVEALLPLELPPVVTVEAFRQIVAAEAGDGAGNSTHFNGRGLALRLADLASPSAQNYDRDRPKFIAINRFAQSVLERSDVEVTVSREGEVQVQQAGRALPLESLGTGIHQVIILASAASLYDRTLICMEEPEVHLHPILQRKLVRFLHEETSNQYLIATHSAHMLDYERASIVHVRHDDVSGTLVRSASTPQDISDVCADLGYRPSDLMQANAVIWVEGPSDRIYLGRWLDLLAPDEFVEGIHYSILFYGGSLLRHLTADDPAVAEFISLRRICRNSAILIDSDKSGPRQNLNDTKIRVRDEFAEPSMPGYAWITSGRTIENYVPAQKLASAVAAVHPRSRFLPAETKWDEPLRLEGPSAGARSTPNKVAIAKVAAEGLDVSDMAADLRREVRTLIELIRSAN